MTIPSRPIRGVDTLRDPQLHCTAERASVPDGILEILKSIVPRCSITTRNRGSIDKHPVNWTSPAPTQGMRLEHLRSETQHPENQAEPQVDALATKLHHTPTSAAQGAISRPVQYHHMSIVLTAQITDAGTHKTAMIFQREDPRNKESSGVSTITIPRLAPIQAQRRPTGLRIDVERTRSELSNSHIIGGVLPDKRLRDDCTLDRTLYPFDRTQSCDISSIGLPSTRIPAGETCSPESRATGTPRRTPRGTPTHQRS